MPRGGRIEAEQLLFQSSFPDHEIQHPKPRTFLPDKEYQFSFYFKVPYCIPHGRCIKGNRCSASDPLHLMLPPTLGDQNVINKAGSRFDDLSSELCSISYLIRAEIQGAGCDEISVPQLLAKSYAHIRIMPISQEIYHLPSYADVENPGLQIRNEVVLRNLKHGRLLCEITGVVPIQLLPPGSEAYNLDSAVTINLEFGGKNKNSIPPILKTICGKLKVSTKFTTDPWNISPQDDAGAVLPQSGISEYIKKLPLSAMRVAPISWTKNSLCSSQTDLEKPSFTTSLTIPVLVPRSKILVPSFSSCIVSRAYVLDVYLSFGFSHTSYFASNIMFKVPVQVVNHNTAGESS